MCDKAVLSREGSRLEAKFYARFLVRGMPQYNNYIVTVGNNVLSNSDTDLQTTHGQLASWLIVVDVSDPRGRRKAIFDSASVAARLVSLMSKESNVRILAMAGSQKVVAETGELREIMTEGAMNHLPIAVSDKNGAVYGHAAFANIVGSLMQSEGVQMDNTYLWIGLSRALKEQMPSCASGPYKNMPRGVILISDGVDESRQSDENLANLIKTANELGIPIHTIAFPFKDSGRNQTARHQGFDALQKLANDTNGGFLNYAADIPDVDNPICIHKLTALLRRTTASVVQLETPVKNLSAASSMQVNLYSGSTSNRANHVGSLTVPQEKVGTIVADSAMEMLYDSIHQGWELDVVHQKALFTNFILPLRKHDELFEMTRVNPDFAIRMQQFLRHIDKYEGLRNDPNIADEAVKCLEDYKRPLPEPPKGDTHVTTHVQSGSPSVNINGGASPLDDYEGDTFKSWVWWTLGVGGACFFVVIFLLIIRALTRSDEYENEAAEGPIVDDVASSAPVLASLVDVNNPGRCWDICKESVSVGRGTAADIRLASDHVSTLHFTLSCDAGQWIIKDANSTNGTMVNGTQVTAPTPIKNGDTISIADMQLAFRLR